MGLVVLFSPGNSLRSARRPSTSCPTVFTIPLVTTGPACALIEAGLDRSSPP
jgi:hypothetical protein